MSVLHDIIDALDQRKNRLLLVAEAAMPASQFQAFRKIVLDELGKSGFQSELEDAIEHSGKDRYGQGRNRK